MNNRLLQSVDDSIQSKDLINQEKKFWSHVIKLLGHISVSSLYYPTINNM